MDSEAVKLWRDKFHLNLSASWKRDVDVTVRDIELWREILENWQYQDKKGKWHKKSPAIKVLLDEYERIRFDRMEADNQRHHEASVVPARGRERVSEGSNGPLRQVRSEAPSNYFRVGDVVCRRNSKV